MEAWFWLNLQAHYDLAFTLVNLAAIHQMAAVAYFFGWLNFLYQLR